MIRVLCRRPGDGAAVELPPSDIAVALANPATLPYIDELAKMGVKFREKSEVLPAK